MTEGRVEEKVKTVRDISDVSVIDINKKYTAAELARCGLVQINSRFVDFRSSEDYIVLFARRSGAYEFVGYYPKSDNFDGNGRYLD